MSRDAERERAEKEVERDTATQIVRVCSHALRVKTILNIYRNWPLWPYKQPDPPGILLVLQISHSGPVKLC